VRNTTADLVIRDLEITGNGSGRCILLENVQNVTVGRLRAGPCQRTMTIASSLRVKAESLELTGSRNLTTVGLQVADSTSVIVANSTISDSGQVGARLSGNALVELRGSSILRNAVTGVEAGPGDVVHHDFFQGNGNGTGPQASGGMNGSWDDGIEGNRWSDLDGPDNDQDGIVDVPYAVAGGAVDRFPLCPAGGCWSMTRPIVRISADVTSGVAPLDVAFTSNVTGGSPPYSYAWTFGDGNVSTDAAPAHRFMAPGTYVTRLEVRDSASQGSTSSPLVIAAAETAPPAVAASVPDEGETDVDLETDVTLRFSTRMSVQSTENAVSIDPAVPLAFTWSADGTTVVAEPEGELAVATLYTVTVGTNATSAGGLNLPAAFTLRFTTSVVRPEFRPEIVGTSPSHGATGVPTNLPDRVSFNVPMDFAATEGAFSAEPGISAAVEWDLAGRSVTYRLTRDLAPETAYSIAFDRGALSAEGARPAAIQRLSFTTASGPDLGPPVVWHGAPSRLLEGKPGALEFSVSDPTGVAEVILHHRRSGDPDYSSTRMEHQSLSLYLGFVPGDSMRAPYLEYYVEAFDLVGNRALDPGGGPGSPYRVAVSKDFPDGGETGLIPARDAATLFTVLVSSVATVLVWDQRRAPRAEKRIDPQGRKSTGAPARRAKA
jgi:PKD repeat protein